MERSGELRRSLDKCGSIKSRLLKHAYLSINHHHHRKTGNFSQLCVCNKLKKKEKKRQKANLLRDSAVALRR